MRHVIIIGNVRKDAAYVFSAPEGADELYASGHFLRVIYDFFLDNDDFMEILQKNMYIPSVSLRDLFVSYQYMPDFSDVLRTNLLSEFIEYAAGQGYVHMTYSHLSKKDNGY